MALLLRQCFMDDVSEQFYLDLRPKYILSSLVLNDLITNEQRKQILQEENPKIQVKILIEILTDTNKSNVFDIFIEALNKENAYYWLADKLQEIKKSLYDDNDITPDHLYHLEIGRVPSKINSFLERKDLLEVIQENLFKMNKNKEKSFVVLHGMTGCGKSVLAVEAVRNSNLFKNCFPNGFCWIPLGNLKSKQNPIFLKLQILWEKLNPEEIFPWSNLESTSKADEVKDAKRALRLTYLRRKPKMLLILDDVWEESIIDTFDIGCPTLITTTNKIVIKNYERRCFCVEIRRGFSLSECKEFFANLLNIHPESLPDVIEAIHEKCKGLPIILSLIGTYMHEYGNDEKRWNYWKEQLDNNGMNALRKRHNSGQLLEYFDTIKHIIEELDEKTKTMFLDFAIFEDDVFIPNKVFEHLWNCKKFDVEDDMQLLYKRSLIYREVDHKQNSFMYGVHDVFTHVLKRMCSGEILKTRHKTLVDVYLKLCTVDNEFDYGLLPNDGYIYNYIGYHLKHADRHDLFPKIFLDLNFLQNKINFSAPGDLLYDFELYKDCFEPEHKDEKDDMVGFLRRNSHLLSRNDCDIKQLALFESSDKTVHDIAKKLIFRKPSKYRAYYEWCNQESALYSNTINIKMDFQILNVATFSPDSSIIAVAVVGDPKNTTEKNANSVLIRESSTGKILETFDGHTDDINYCAFSQDGTLLATASSDKTIKLWNISLLVSATKMRRRSKGNIKDVDISDFKQSFIHDNEVTWCSFSFDSKYIVSGDNVGVVYVWNSEHCNLIWKFRHSDNIGTIDQNILESVESPITACSFFLVPYSDSNYVASVADTSIKLWNCDLRRCERKVLHDKYISAFCFPKKKAKEILIYFASDSSIWEWNWDKNSYTKIFEKNQCCISSCCISPDEQFLAAGTSDASVIIWNLESNKNVAYLRSQQGNIRSVEYSKDGCKLLSATDDGYITIWEMNNYDDSNPVSMISLENNLSVLNNQENLIIASSDQLNRIQIRKGITGDITHKSLPDSSEITACCLSPDFSEVIYGTNDGSVKSFSLTNERTIILYFHNAKVTYLIYTENNRIISCSEDSLLKVRCQRTQSCVTLKGHSAPVIMCVPFNCGKKILSCSENGKLIAWENEQFSEPTYLLLPSGHGNQKINFCDVSTDEKAFCSASSDKTIVVYNADTAQIIQRLECDACVRCCRFFTNSLLLVSGEDSGLVMIWNHKDHFKKSLTLGKVDGWVKDVKFSKNNEQILAIGESISLFYKDGLDYKLAQTFILPGAFTCALWASSNFDILIFVRDSILYILKKINI